MLFGASVPLEKSIEFVPDAAVSVGEPQLVLPAPEGSAMSIAPGVLGSVSEKETPLIVAGVGLVTVKVKVEVPPALVGSGEKFLEISSKL